MNTFQSYWLYSEIGSSKGVYTSNPQGIVDVALGQWDLFIEAPSPEMGSALPGYLNPMKIMHAEVFPII